MTCLVPPGEEGWLIWSDAYEAGRISGLDHLPRHVPFTWSRQEEEWLRGYDYGIEEYDRIVKSPDIS